VDENPAHEQLLILSLDNWEAEIPTDVHIATTTTTQNPRRQNSETDNPKKKALKLLLIKRTNKLLGGSSFQSNSDLLFLDSVCNCFWNSCVFSLDDDADDDDEDFVVGWWLNADGIDSMCRLRGCLFVGSQSDMWKRNPGCFLDL